MQFKNKILLALYLLCFTPGALLADTSAECAALILEVNITHNASILAAMNSLAALAGGVPEGFDLGKRMSSDMARFVRDLNLINMEVETRVNLVNGRVREFLDAFLENYPRIKNAKARRDFLFAVLACENTSDKLAEAVQKLRGPEHDLNVYAAQMNYFALGMRMKGGNRTNAKEKMQRYFLPNVDQVYDPLTGGLLHLPPERVGPAPKAKRAPVAETVRILEVDDGGSTETEHPIIIEGASNLVGENHSIYKPEPEVNTARCEMDQEVLQRYGIASGSYRGFPFNGGLSIVRRVELRLEHLAITRFEDAVLRSVASEEIVLATGIGPLIGNYPHKSDGGTLTFVPDSSAPGGARLRLRVSTLRSPSRRLSDLADLLEAVVARWPDAVIDPLEIAVPWSVGLRPESLPKPPQKYGKLLDSRRHIFELVTGPLGEETPVVVMVRGRQFPVTLREVEVTPRQRLSGGPVRSSDWRDTP